MSALNDDDDVATNAPGLRKTMSSLHTWTGLLVGWILYAMFLTGTVAYFRDETSQWMRPEFAHQQAVPDAAEVSQRVVGTLAATVPQAVQWSFALPDERNNVVNASWNVIPGREGFRSAILDPSSGQPLKARETKGGDFFYTFHFQFHYMSPFWGRWLAGLCAMFMLVAIISGVITHKKIFIDFFTFRWGKGQRSWLDAHNALSVFGLPFHFMITYSGLITLAFLYMPWSRDVAFKTPAEAQVLMAEIIVGAVQTRRTGKSGELAPVADMVRQAQERWGRDNIGRVTVTAPGDVAARVLVVRGDFSRASVSPQYMLFEGTSGNLLQIKDQVGAAAETRGVIYALHLGRFADITLRWLYFIVSLAGTAMVGTGLVMWTVKRRAKLPDPERPYLGFMVVERLNIGAIAGLSIAMAAFLWGNRLIPAGIVQRGDWEIHLFFIVWALTLVHAMLRPAKKAWIEQFWFGAALLALLPVINAVVTNRGLITSVIEGDWIFAGFDLTLFSFAILHGALAVRTMRHKPKVRKPRRVRAQAVGEAA